MKAALFEMKKDESQRDSHPFNFCLASVEAEEVFDLREYACVRLLFAGVYLGACGESRAALVDCVAERFDEVWVCLEESLHRVLSDLKNFGLVRGDDVRRARLAREESHLAEEVA